MNTTTDVSENGQNTDLSTNFLSLSMNGVTVTPKKYGNPWPIMHFLNFDIFNCCWNKRLDVCYENDLIVPTSIMQR